MQSNLAPGRLRIAVGYLTAARLVLNTGHRMVYPFLPAIARGLGVSLQSVGALVSLRWLAGMATPVVVSTVGRGERRRRLIAFSLAVFAIGAVLTAASSVFVGAAVGFALMGLGKASFDVGGQAYIADRTAYASRARYMSVVELTWAGGLLVGAPLAGWLIDRAGWQAPFWAVAGLAGVGLTVLWWTLQPDERQVAGTLVPLRLDRSAVALLVVFAMFSAAAEHVFVVFGAWLEDAFGLSLIALGTSALLVGVSELAGEGTALACADRMGKRRAVAAGMALAVVAYSFIGVGQHVYLVGIAALSVSLFAFELTIVSAIPLASEIRPHGRTRYLSLMVVAAGIGRAAGAYLGPFVFERVGVGGNAIGAAILNLLAVVVLLILVREGGDTTPGSVAAGNRRPAG